MDFRDQHISGKWQSKDRSERKNKENNLQYIHHPCPPVYSYEDRLTSV